MEQTKTRGQAAWALGVDDGKLGPNKYPAGHFETIIQVSTRLSATSTQQLVAACRSTAVGQHLAVNRRPQPGNRQQEGESGPPF